MAEKIEIKIKGYLAEHWKDWFEGAEITYQGENTMLIYKNRDQAFVHGVLNQIRDLNLKLISVNSIQENK